jgi:hypothetical protein
MHQSTRMRVAQNLDYHVRMFEHYDEKCKQANKSLEKVQQGEQSTGEEPTDEVALHQEEIIEAKAIQDVTEGEKIRDLHREVAEQLRDILQSEPDPAIPIHVQMETHPVLRNTVVKRNVSPNAPESPLAQSSFRIGRG